MKESFWSEKKFPQNVQVYKQNAVLEMRRKISASLVKT